MADQLRIEIDVTAAKAALDALSQSFTTFQANATTQTAGVSKVISRLNEQMRNIRAIDSNVLTSLQQFNTAVQNIQSGALSTAADALSRFSTSSSGVQVTAEAVRALSQNIQGLRAPEGIDRMSVSFRTAGNAASQAAKQTRDFAVAQRKIENDIRGIGREIANTVGYMLNMGVTTGNLARAMSDLGKQGISLGQIFQGLQRNFGNFGAVTAVLGGVAIGLRGIYEAAQLVLGPVLQTGMALQAFGTAVDAIDGKSGAGTAALSALKDIAAKTATDINVLTKNYLGFRAAAESTGVSAADTLKIYEGISVGLRALNRDAISSERAFTALTQMMSKGTVNAEELKQQLGDALPGAVTYAAQAMGKTTAELQKMMESGQLLAKDLLPRLSQLFQTKFGEAVATQAQLAQGQIAQLGNAMTYLREAMANGFNGGALAGFTQGLKALNEAMNSASILAFAKVLGDLMGVMQALVGGVIGGFITGFTAIADAIGHVIEKIVGFIPGAQALVDWFQKSGGVMNVVASVSKVLGAAIGALAAQYVLLNAKVLLASAAKTVYQATLGRTVAMQTAGAVSTARLTTALGAQTAAAATATTATTVLSAAVARLNTVIKANPIALVIAALVGLGSVIYDAIGGWDGLTAKVAAFSGSSVDAAAKTDTVQQALQKFVDTAAQTPEKIIASANSMFTFTEAAKAAKQEVQAIDIQLKDVKNSMDAHKMAIDSAKNKQEQWVAGLKSEKLALQSQLAQVQQSSKEYKSLFGAQTLVSDGSARLKQQIQEVSSQINSSNNNFQQWSLRQKEGSLSMTELTQKLKEQKQAIQTWGVVLNKNADDLARQLVSLGKTKEEAAQMAFSIQEATRSWQDQADVLDKAADRNELLAQILIKQVDAAKQNLDAFREHRKEKGLDAEETERLIKAQTDLLASTESGISSALQAAAAQRTVATALREDISIREAAKKVAEDFASRYGKNIEVAELEKKALEDLKKQITGTSDEMAKAAGNADKLAGSSQSTAEKIKEASEASDKASGNVKKVSDAMDQASGTFSGIRDTLSGIASYFTKASESAHSLGLTFPPLEASFARIAEVLPNLNAGLTPFNEAFSQFAQSAATAGPQMTVLAQSFTQISQAVLTSSQPMVAFAGALSSIPETAPGIDIARVSLEQMIAYLRDSAADFARATEQMYGLAATGAAVKDGFATAQAGTEQYIGVLSDLLSALDTVIQRMNDLKRAAEEALAAAQAAASAGGGTTDAGSGRYGGMSESLPEKMSVPSDAFKNAPAFAEGTANTSRQLSKLPGGGIPSILHPNEAVVPLSRGRQIPVDIRLEPVQIDTSGTIDERPFEQIADGLNKLNMTFSRGFSAVTANSGQQTSDLTSPTVDVNLNAPDIRGFMTNFGRNSAVSENSFVGTFGNPADMSFNASAPGGPNRPNNSGTQTGDGSTTNNQTITVTINLNSEDVDGFRRSEDQIVRSLADKIKRATRRVSS